MYKNCIRKVLCLLIPVLELIILAAVPLFACADVTFNFKADTDEDILDICQDGSNAAYLLTTKRILKATVSKEKQADFEELAANKLGIDKFCAVSDGLVGITKSGEFYKLQDSSWVKCGSLRAESNDEETYISIRDVRAVNNILYILVFTDEAEENQLLAFDMSAKTIDVLPVKSPECFCAYKDNALLFCTAEDDGCTLYIYEPESKAASPLDFSSEIPYMQSIFYDAEQDTIYALIYGQVVFSQNGNEFKAFAAIKNVDRFVVLGKDSLLAWSGNSVYKLTKDSGNSLEKLTFMGLSTRFDNDFMAATGIQISQFESPSMTTMEHISLALTSRDSTVDIYSFLTRDGLSRVCERKMYTDLSKSEILTKMSKELYPAIQSVIYDNDKLVGWPIGVFPLLRMEDKSLLSQYGFKSPTTMDELLDLLPIIVNSGVIEDNNLRLFDTLNYTQKDMLTFLMRQFIFYQQQQGMEIDFNNDVFRHLAKRIMSEVPLESPFPEEEGDETPFFIMSSVSPVIQEDLLPQLKLDDKTDAAIETWVQIAIVNPFSENKAQALKYLEFFSQQKDAESYTAYKSMKKPFKSPYVAKKIAQLNNEIESIKSADDKEGQQNAILELEEKINSLKQNEYLVTEAAIANYHALAKRFVVSENELVQYDDSLEKTLDQFIAGKFTLDEFIAECNRHINLIYGENKQ